MVEDIYEKIPTLRSKGIRLALATIIARKGATPRKDSAKMLIDENGIVYGNLGGGDVEEKVIEEARKIIRSGTPRILGFDLSGNDPDENVLVCGGHMEVYVEPITPDPVLYIFGAGHVGKALANIAAFAGFRIVVLDDRKKYATAERFPRAEEFFIDTWDNLLQKNDLSRDAYIFISTRDHHIDELCLRFALKSSARYVGMLGSLKKIMLLEEFMETEKLDSSRFRSVSIPVGFDIGAESPEEIAVSIAAELIAARKNRDVLRLKDAVHNAAANRKD